MLSPSAIAEKFRATDVHDDTVEGFQFVPAVKRGAKAKVIVTLFRYWENKRYLLTFDGCANVPISLDADVGAACGDAGVRAVATQGRLPLGEERRALWRPARRCPGRRAVLLKTNMVPDQSTSSRMKTSAKRRSW
jgi:hypothetical protein